MSPAAFSHLRHSLKRRAGLRQKRISAILRSFSNKGGVHPTVGDLSKAFDARAFGAFFILFGGINLVPLPPGASFVCGIPLLLATIQLALGRRRLWLPERVRRIHLSPETLAKVMTKIGPPLRRIERLARHRFWPASEIVVVSAIGWFCLLLALLVALPMPLTNMFPGVAIALMGVALVARDGYWLAAGVIAGIGSILLLAVFYGAALLALLQFL